MTALVYLNPHATASGTSRCGTVFATLDDVRRVLGRESETASVDGKVKAQWKFDTPRGTATIHDYWWNPPDQQSIGARNRMAALWLRRHLRALGLRTSGSIGK